MAMEYRVRTDGEVAITKILRKQFGIGLPLQ